MPINQNAPSLDEIKRQILMLHLAKLRGGMDPGRQAVLDKRQQGREDLATMGQFAAGMDEAASTMGGTKPSVQIPAQARTFESRAAAGRKALDSGSGLGLDPKVFSHLKAIKSAKSKIPGIKYSPGIYDPETGETRKYRLDPETGERMGEGFLTGSEQYQRERDARKDYETDKKVQRTLKIEEEYNKLVGLIDDSIRRRPTGPNAVAIITQFMRFLDPESVVRESEFIIAAKAGGWIDEMEGKFAKLFGQGELTVDVLKEYKHTINTIWKIVRDGQNKYDNQKFGDYKGRKSWSPVAGATTTFSPGRGDKEEIPIPEDIKNMSDEELRKAAGE